VRLRAGDLARDDPHPRVRLARPHLPEHLARRPLEVRPGRARGERDQVRAEEHVARHHRHVDRARRRGGLRGAGEEDGGGRGGGGREEA
jgi:hypothetical protein